MLRTIQIVNIQNIVLRNYKLLTQSLRLHTTASVSRPYDDDGDKGDKIALLKSEMEAEKRAGNVFVPTNLNERMWEKLLNIESIDERKVFYRQIKMTELNNAAKIPERKLVKKRTPLTESKIRDNLSRAVTSGQKVVFDLGYENRMDRREMAIAIEEIVRATEAVQKDKDAFHVHFCNVNSNGRMERRLLPVMSSLQKELMTITEKSYLELFPKERIVYLVPDCLTDMEYDSEDVYVIGGIVDLRGQGLLSLAKAKKEGVRMARFPIQKHYKLPSSLRESESLALDQVMDILITIKQTNNWKSALKHIPKLTIEFEQTEEPRKQNNRHNE